MQRSDQSIVRQILAYLADRPGSEDTVEGIAEWWLLEQFIKVRVSEVREALAELLRIGLVIARPGPDGRLRYQANAERMPEIRSYFVERSL